MAKTRKTTSWLGFLNGAFVTAIIGLVAILLQTRKELKIIEQDFNAQSKLQDQQHVNGLIKSEVDNRLKKDLERYVLQLDHDQQLERQTTEINARIEAINQEYERRIAENERQVELNLKEVANFTALEFMERQLSEFYWPLLYRLEKNNSLYKLLGDDFVGENLDNNVILPNHLEILNILENKIYLAQADSELISKIQDYIEHVNIYYMLRKGGFPGYPEDYYPEKSYSLKLYHDIRTRTEELQSKYNDILDTTHIGLVRLNSTFQMPLAEKDELLSSNQELASQVVTYPIVLKLSKTNKSFIKPIENGDTIYSIAFKSYSEEEKICILEIGKKSEVNANKGKRVIVSNGQPYVFEPNKLLNYHISLEGTYIQKNGLSNRRMAILKVQKWTSLKKE